MKTMLALLAAVIVGRAIISTLGRSVASWSRTKVYAIIIILLRNAAGALHVLSYVMISVSEHL